MTNLANLKRITDEDTARTILGMIKGDIEPEDVSEACAKWVASCYHEPRRSEKVLEAANELLGGYGVEANFGDRCAWPEYAYVNKGETYADTLFALYDASGCSVRYRVSNLGAMEGDR